MLHMVEDVNVLRGGCIELCCVVDNGKRLRGTYYLTSFILFLVVGWRADRERAALLNTKRATEVFQALHDVEGRW